MLLLQGNAPYANFDTKTGIMTPLKINKILNINGEQMSCDATLIRYRSHHTASLNERDLENPDNHELYLDMTATRVGVVLKRSERFKDETVKNDAIALSKLMPNQILLSTYTEKKKMYHVGNYNLTFDQWRRLGRVVYEKHEFCYRISFDGSIVQFFARYLDESLSPFEHDGMKSFFNNIFTGTFSSTSIPARRLVLHLDGERFKLEYLGDRQSFRCMHPNLLCAIIASHDCEPMGELDGQSRN